MASGSKTANAGLTKWERTDTVEVEDFNSLLDSIDLAIGKRMDAQLLRDITPVQNIRTIFTDLSDMDINDYLLIVITFEKISSLVMRLNKEAYTDLGYGIDGSITFLLPFKDASRDFVSVALLMDNNHNSIARPLIKYSAINGLTFVMSGTVESNAKIRIWGVK